MRQLAAVLVCAVVFGVLALGAGALMGVWDHVEPVTPAAAPATTTEEQDSPSAPTVKGSGSHEFRMRLNRRDTTVAKQAVVRSSDLLPLWIKARSRAASLRCPANDPDLSRFTVTGLAKSGFRMRGPSVATISSSVLLFPHRADAREFFRLTANRAALTCIRHEVDRVLRANGLGAKVVAAQFARQPALGEQTAIYTVVISSTTADGTQIAWPVDVVAFQVSRTLGLVVFQNVANDKLNLTRSVVGRLFRVNAG